MDLQKWEKEQRFQPEILHSLNAWDTKLKNIQDIIRLLMSCWKILMQILQMLLQMVNLIW